jgi:hypothetical protein
MDVSVAISAERDQIFVYVVAQQASRAKVVDLETIGAAIQPCYSQHRSKIKRMIGSIGISLGKRLRQPCIVPIDIIVEIHTAVFIHSCGGVQDQHGNR